MAVAVETETRSWCPEQVVHGVHADLVRAALNNWGPYSAFILAERNGVHGNRETQRRTIRAAVERLRDKPIGARICANRLGYWMARDATEWEEYLEARKADARFAFVHERKIREAARDVSNEQGRLF
ncbi:MAG: hypothetical protein KAV00_11980 [Phycisphaerae bacterium]|nr:hypothetical protein [Phycisphaerae bacterium]